MKEKKTKRTRKVLLMGIAAVLVAAVSVSATLAYLTAQTSPVTNTFKGSGGITGKVLEPNFVSSSSFKYTVNKPVDKDPLVQNNTTNAAIYAGVRVSYWIKVDPEQTSYTQVTPTVFANYVTIGNLDTTNWADITPNTWVTEGTNADSDADKACKYYLYNSVLKKKDSTDPYNSTTQTYTGNDSTQPLFKTVTVKPEVNISSSGTYTGATIPDAPGTNKFKCFDYKIIIAGYGVKAYSVKDGTDDTVEGDVLYASASAAQSDILNELKKLDEASAPTTTAANP